MTRKLFAGVIGAYAVALVALAPATLLDAALHRASGGRIRVAGAQGTVWRGAARIETGSPDAAAAFMQAVRWQLKPLALLQGKVLYEVALADPERKVPVAIGAGGAEISGIDVRLPAALAAAWIPELAALQLGGTIDLHVEKAVIAGNGVRGQALITWKDAASRLVAVERLGTYVLRLSAEGRTGRVNLSTDEGVLELAGEGVWKAAARPAFRGVAKVEPRERERLLPLLRVIAREQADGRFEMNW